MKKRQKIIGLATIKLTTQNRFYRTACRLRCDRDPEYIAVRVYTGNAGRSFVELWRCTSSNIQCAMGFGVLLGLRRKGEFPYRFAESNLERFRELIACWQNPPWTLRSPPVPEHRAESRNTDQTPTSLCESCWPTSCSGLMNSPSQ